MHNTSERFGFEVKFKANCTGRRSTETFRPSLHVRKSAPTEITQHRIACLPGESQENPRGEKQIGQKLRNHG